ncbi:MAG TPA: hypothetical protein VN894_20290, partial [Polyangiaceae bacterium]|nr:hypothetical protein [Polyangiaceae bacterium]
MTLRSTAGWLLIAAGAWASTSCSPSGFQSPSLIDSVRILASSADQPYAKPGATVNVQVLAVDGRPTKPASMTIYWLPFACINPRDDAYYACFSRFAGTGGGAAADAGVDSGMGEGGALAGGPLQPGIDLTQVLPAGPSFPFTMPADVVATHMTKAGTTPYGLAIVFNIACAGRLELLPFDPSNVQAPPVGCFDAQRNQLGPSDFVFGFSRVYAYEQIENTNPVIDHIDVEGKTVDLQLGFQTPPCTASHCASIHIGPVVPASSQESNPLEKDVNGGPLKEEIWADFFSDVGLLDDESRLLYNTTTGSVGDPSVT